MADENRKTRDPGERAPSESASLSDAASHALENLAELEPQLVNAGIFDRAGSPVALTTGSTAWADEAAEVLSALKAGSGEEILDSAHIASADGEVFVVSESGLSLVAVTGRFVLASLSSYDMRMALRDAARSQASAEDPESSHRAKKQGPEDA